MTKVLQTQSDFEENKKRLQEIAETSFGTSSDDVILQLLAERKQLADLENAYVEAEEEAALRLEQERIEKEREEKELKALQKQKAVIGKKIAELNKSITPDKDDDDLLTLIAERKELEEELAKFDAKSLAPKDEILPEEGSSPQTVLEVMPEMVPEKELPLPVEQKAVAQKEVLAAAEDKEKEETAEPPSAGFRDSVDREYGNEKIQDSGVVGGSEFLHYLDQLKNNVGSLGELLQAMSLAAKKNKAFMLKVAEIDPAYAMHYADKETLKRDEDFNMHIASMGNPRNSGNALAEMLPEARTSKVLLAAVKQDYRNVRFIQPDMEQYDEMLDMAKKSVLQKVRDLKEATDVALLIPKLLKQDKQFMQEVETITGSK